MYRQFPRLSPEKELKRHKESRCPSITNDNGLNRENKREEETKQYSFWVNGGIQKSVCNLLMMLLILVVVGWLVQLADWLPSGRRLSSVFDDNEYFSLIRMQKKFG